MQVVLHNFRTHRSLERSFSPGFTRLNGRVAIGKTTLLDSIQWALYGGPDYAPRVWSSCPMHRKITDLGKFPQKATIVFLSINLNNNTFYILRQANSAALYFWQNNQDFSQAVRDGVAQALIESHFGSELLWQACSYSVQKEYHPLLVASNSTRKKIIDQMMSHRYQGTIPPDQILAKVNAEISELNHKLVVLETQIGVLTNQWNQMRNSNHQLSILYDQNVSEEHLTVQVNAELDQINTQLDQCNQLINKIGVLNGKIALIKQQQADKIRRLNQIHTQYPNYNADTQVQQINHKREEQQNYMTRLAQVKEQISKLEQVWQEQHTLYQQDQAEYYNQQKNNQVIMDNYQRELSSVNQQNQIKQQQYQAALQQYSLDSSIRTRCNTLRDQIEQAKASPEFTINVSILEQEGATNGYTVTTLSQAWDRWNQYSNQLANLPPRWDKYKNRGAITLEQINKRFGSLQQRTSVRYNNIVSLVASIKTMTIVDLPMIKQIIEQNNLLLSQLEQQIELSKCVLTCPSCTAQLRLKEQRELVKLEHPLNTSEIETRIGEIRTQQTMLIQYRNIMEQYIQLSIQLTGSVQNLEYWKPSTQDMINELEVLTRLKGLYTTIPIITVEIFQKILNYRSVVQRINIMETELTQLTNKLGNSVLDTPIMPELVAIPVRPMIQQPNFPRAPDDSELKRTRMEASQLQSTLDNIEITINRLKDSMEKYPKELITELQQGIIEDDITITTIQSEIDEIDISSISTLNQQKSKLVAQLELLKMFPSWRKHQNEINLLNIRAIGLRDELTVAQELRQITIESESASLQNSVSAFNTVLSNYLADLFDNSITVELSLFKETKGGDTRPIINFQIYKDGKEITGFKTFSGGESIQLSLAITMAMANICGTGILLLDETTIFLDTARRERSTELIYNSGLAEYIIMVDHEGLEAHFNRQSNME